MAVPPDLSGRVLRGKCPLTPNPLSPEGEGALSPYSTGMTTFGPSSMVRMPGSGTL